MCSYIYQTAESPYIQYWARDNGPLFRQNMRTIDRGTHWELLTRAPRLKQWPTALKINGRRVDLLFDHFISPLKDPETRSAMTHSNEKVRFEFFRSDQSLSSSSEEASSDYSPFGAYSSL
jgi:hypothetical protein